MNQSIKKKIENQIIRIEKEKEEYLQFGITQSNNASGSPP